MASGPITPRQTDGETMETVRDYFGSLQNHYRVHHEKCWAGRKHKLESRLLGEISVTSDMQMRYMAESEEEPLDESEREE